LQQERVATTLSGSTTPLDRFSGALLLYGSMPPALATKALTRELVSPVSYVRETALQILTVLGTTESKRVLDSIRRLSALPESVSLLHESCSVGLRAALAAHPPYNRDEVIRRLRQIPDYGDGFYGVAGDEDFATAAIQGLRADDVQMLIEARRRSITGVNAASINEFLALTRVLFGVSKRLRIE
jgi:hypothetical protein